MFFAVPSTSNSSDDTSLQLRDTSIGNHPRTEVMPLLAARRRPVSRRERSIDVSLSANLDGSGLIANDPDHNQFVDVSYFAQTPGR